MAQFQRISPCLWFDSEAEQAANFYISVFKNSRIIRTTHYTEVGQEHHGKPAGSVMTVEFALDGQEFTALNGGPVFKFSEAISLQVFCETQDEVDYYWAKLTDGGEESQCGWLKDRFGLSWQVTPLILNEMLDGSDPEKTRRALAAMFTMQKLDIAALQRAYNGE